MEKFIKRYVKEYGADVKKNINQLGKDRIDKAVNLCTRGYISNDEAMRIIMQVSHTAEYYA